MSASRYWTKHPKTIEHSLIAQIATEFRTATYEFRFSFCLRLEKRFLTLSLSYSKLLNKAMSASRYWTKLPKTVEHWLIGQIATEFRTTTYEIRFRFCLRLEKRFLTPTLSYSKLLNMAMSASRYWTKLPKTVEHSLIAQIATEFRTTTYEIRFAFASDCRIAFLARLSKTQSCSIWL